MKYSNKFLGSKLVDDFDYDTVLQTMFTDYKSKGYPIEVNFRSLVEFHSGIDRATHLLHPYPAKLLVNIPYFFLNCSSLASAGHTVLDPFCGSGTVLLESILLGCNAIGADSNPLARLISKVKTRSLSSVRLNGILKKIMEHKAGDKTGASPQNLVNWERWYSKNVIFQLRHLSGAIDNNSSGATRDFFKVCFSACAKKVSQADPKISVPVRLNPERYPTDSIQYVKTVLALKKLKAADVKRVFEEIVLKNIKRLSRLKENAELGAVQRICKDARKLTGVERCSVDLIITSPPYGSAQKYIRSSGLNIGWLNLSPDSTLRSLEKKNIGREHYLKSEYENYIESPVIAANSLLKDVFEKNPLRSHISANYLKEMKDAILESYRVLKKDKYFILIIGNNEVCGENFDTKSYLKEVCEDIGFELKLIMRDNIDSRGLMTKRNKSASIITCEWVMVFKK